MEKIGVVFDNDGIIVDTEPLHFKARVLALEELGITYTTKEYVAKGISRHHHFFLQNACPLEKLPPSEYDDFFYNNIQAKYKSLLARELMLVAGIEELLDRISKIFLLAVASTQPLEMVERVLKMSLGYRVGYFQAIVSGEQVSRNKPWPDVYLKAAELLKIPPSSCVAIEDSAVGVKAAKSAGMTCIARLSEWSTSIALAEAGADIVVADYEGINQAMIASLTSC